MHFISKSKAPSHVIHSNKKIMIFAAKGAHQANLWERGVSSMGGGGGKEKKMQIFYTFNPKKNID